MDFNPQNPPASIAELAGECWKLKSTHCQICHCCFAATLPQIVRGSGGGEEEISNWRVEGRDERDGGENRPIPDFKASNPGKGMRIAPSGPRHPRGFQKHYWRKTDRSRGKGGNAVTFQAREP